MLGALAAVQWLRRVRLWPRQAPLSVNFAGRNTGGHLPDPGWSPGPQRWQMGSLPLSHRGSLKRSFQPLQLPATWAPGESRPARGRRLAEPARRERFRPPGGPSAPGRGPRAERACDAGPPGSIPAENIAGERVGRGARQAPAHGVTELDTTEGT